MSRRGHADGSRLVGWDAIRARAQSRHPHHRTERLHATTAACNAWLERHHAIITPARPDRPYFTVYLGARFFTAGPTRHAAIERAMRTRIPGPPS